MFSAFCGFRVTARPLCGGRVSFIISFGYAFRGRRLRGLQFVEAVGEPPRTTTDKQLEKQMSNSIKTLLALCTVAFVAACAQPQEEYVVVEPEPISHEPAYTGKYK